MSQTQDLELNASCNLGAAKSLFAASGQTQVKNVLTDKSADRLERTLLKETPWNLVLNDETKHFDLHKTQTDALTLPKKKILASNIARGGRGGFQYVFDNYPLADLAEAGADMPPVLSAATALVNSEPFLDMARAVTGFDEIEFADIQATRYRPGHFLTAHTDNVEGKNRLCAYVLNMTRVWRPDWGGLLLFEDDEQNISSGLTPSFNTLNMFSVPRPHAVSMVTPHAGAHRLSLTGWLRKH